MIPTVSVSWSSCFFLFLILDMLYNFSGFTEPDPASLDRDSCKNNQYTSTHILNPPHSNPTQIYKNVIYNNFVHSSHLLQSYLPTLPDLSSWIDSRSSRSSWYHSYPVKLFPCLNFVLSFSALPWSCSPSPSWWSSRSRTRSPGKGSQGRKCG